MNKNSVILVLGVAVLALALVVVRQRRQIEVGQAVAEREVAKMEAQVAALSKIARAEPQQKKVAVPEPAQPVEASDSKSGAAEPAAPVTVQSAGMGTNFLGAIADMMKSPQMKEMMRAQQKVVVGQMYGALPRYLNLSAEQKEQLDKLLLERHLAMAEAGMAMMSGSAEDRKKALEDSKTIKAEHDLAIQELLGDQDYKVFKQYEESLPEQTHVSMFKSTLSGDDALTEQQENDLVSAMWQARKELPQNSLLNQQNESPDPSQMTEERIAEALKQMEQLQQGYAEGATAILSATQLEHFKQWQQQMASMQRAGLSIAAQMFGQPKKGEPVARP